MATIKHESTRTEVSYSVADAPPLKRQYMPVTLIPNRVTVTFFDASWYSLTIRGPVVKKDGTAGVNTTEESFYASHEDDPVPDWAQALTDPGYAAKFGGR